MKKMSGMLTVLATAALTSGIASAAGVNDTSVKVPFSFIVGNTEMPAGDYIVKELPYTAGVVAVERADGSVSATTLAVTGDTQTPGATSELVFQKFEDHYFLARVTSPDGPDREVVLTPAQMKKAIAAASQNELASIGRLVPVN